MMLMVSVQNLTEAIEAHQGGADIVDVKNLQEALVGSGHPTIVESVRSQIPHEKHVSVTLGVVPNQAGTVAMAVYAAGRMNATSVKVGFMNTDYKSAVDILLQSREALAGTQTKLIGSLFADNPLYDGLAPHFMVQLAQDGQCDGWLIDTLTKDGRNLFDFMTESELHDMVFKGKELKMSTALSGHLRMQDINELSRINPDIVGVRGAVCASGDRQTSVARESVASFKYELDLRQSGQVDVFNTPTEEITHSLPTGWIVIDGSNKSCAGIIASLTAQIEQDETSIIEVILPDLLTVNDLIMWAEKGNHNIITQRKDADGQPRLLIQP